MKPTGDRPLAKHVSEAPEQEPSLSGLRSDVQRKIADQMSMAERSTFERVSKTTYEAGRRSELMEHGPEYVKRREEISKMGPATLLMEMEKFKSPKELADAQPELIFQRMEYLRSHPTQMSSFWRSYVAQKVDDAPEEFGIREFLKKSIGDTEKQKLEKIFARFLDLAGYVRDTQTDLPSLVRILAEQKNSEALRLRQKIVNNHFNKGDQSKSQNNVENTARAMVSNDMGKALEGYLIAFPEIQKTELMFLAAAGGKVEALKGISNSGANIDAATFSVEGTPRPVSLLHKASHDGDGTAASTALKVGANVNVKNEGGITPLHLAKNPEMVNALAAAGGDVNAESLRGETPLHSAALRDDPAVTEALLKKGAKVNAQARNGFTPLHFASSHIRANSPEVISVLGRNGADPNVQDKKGKTALDLAERLKTREGDPIRDETKKQLMLDAIQQIPEKPNASNL